MMEFAQFLKHQYWRHALPKVLQVFPFLVSCRSSLCHKTPIGFPRRVERLKQEGSPQQGDPHDSPCGLRTFPHDQLGSGGWLLDCDVLHLLFCHTRHGAEAWVSIVASKLRLKTPVDKLYIATPFYIPTGRLARDARLQWPVGWERFYGVQRHHAHVPKTCHGPWRNWYFLQSAFFCTIDLRKMKPFGEEGLIWTRRERDHHLAWFPIEKGLLLLGWSIYWTRLLWIYPPTQ